MSRLRISLVSSGTRSNTALLLAAFATCLPAGPGQAQRSSELAIPTQVQVDWTAAANDAQGLSQLLSLPSRDRAFSPQHRSGVARRLETFAIKEGMTPLAHLNEAVSDLFPNVGAVPIPVLAPFQTSRFLDQRSRLRRGTPRPPQSDRRRFIADAGGSLQLMSAATGYDAIVTYAPDALARRGITSTKRRIVHVAGANLTYGREPTGELVADMQAEYPGLRRYLGADEVGYTFRKYGVPYFAVASCSPERTDPETLPCDQAEDLVRATVRNLQLLGGSPLRLRRAPAAPEQPGRVRARRASTTFQYFPPGKLLDNTGDDGMEGTPDRTVYATIRFPIKDAPSFAQSQVFMHGGNCLSTPGTTDHMVFLPAQPGDRHPRYRCVQNQKQLLQWEGHPENYNYPWRDNFCEARGGASGSTQECPAGRGHAGQDIRPKDCPGAATSSQCRTDTHPVVAVATGNACRDGNKLRLRFNTTSLYYVYLHMNTRTMQAAGIRDGRCTAVASGQVIGKVGNFQDVRGGTTTHLHLEIHPIDIHSRFNPYMTLIRAYEQLIGATGTEITTTASQSN